MMRGLLLMASLLTAGTACHSGVAVVYTGQAAAPAAEEGREVEAIVAVPAGGTLVYDIWYSGFFATHDDVDFAVLREICRPGRLKVVTDGPIPFLDRVTAYMYTPREVAFACEAPATAQVDGAVGPRAAAVGR